MFHSLMALLIAPMTSGRPWGLTSMVDNNVLA